MRGAALALAAAAGLIGDLQFHGSRNVGDVFDFSSLIVRYRPTNKGSRRPATMPARPRRTRAQKLRTQARRARKVAA